MALENMIHGLGGARVLVRRNRRAVLDVRCCRHQAFLLLLSSAVLLVVHAVLRFKLSDHDGQAHVPLGQGPNRCFTRLP